MRERIGQILKITCLVLAALLLYQLVQTAFRINPLARVTIPALPMLDSDTNAPTAVSGKGTNSALALTKGTNSSPGLSGTNVGAAKTTKETGTNVLAGVSTNLNTTNIAGSPPPAGARENAVTRENGANSPTNSPAQASERTMENPETNSPAFLATATNPTNVLPGVSETNTALSAVLAETNVTLQILSKETNASPVAATGETNPAAFMAIGGTNGAASKTNSASRSKSKSTNSPSPAAMAMAGMSGSQPGMRGGGGKPADLPPEIKARVDRIYESELFGMVMRPQPMALQGIAGNSAFLRSPSGQTGLVKEGDSLGEIKLLKIGINRVLVEQDGKKTELTIFDGYGSESLMPKDKENSKDKEISK